MVVKFLTNINNYQTNCLPDNLTIPPRKGEKVLVIEAFSSHFANKKLPLRLEVVDVIWTDKGVVCELHYCDIDVRIAKSNGVNLF